ncbi:hypothetical protein IQ25_03579 [Novosphingobium taihuense]|nr:hypothetical protein IQ25_03579 [Novosphingobium taihuense]
MRRLLFFVALPAAFVGSVSVRSQEVNRGSRQLELNATAAFGCVVRTPRALASSNASFSSTGDGGGRVVLTRLVDPDTALPRPSTVELAIPATCNASHRVTAISAKGGLGRIGAAGAPGQGFAELLPYALRVNWAGAQVERASNAGSLALVIPNGATGDIALRVATPEGGTPLVAGSYDDTIVIQLQPTD